MTTPSYAAHRSPAPGLAATPPSRMQLTRWLFARTRNLLAPLALSVVARILNQLLGVALLVVAVSAAAQSASASIDLVPIIVTIVAIAIAKAALRYLEHYTGHFVAFAALQRLRELFFERLTKTAPASTSGESSGDLTTRATRDIDRIEVFFAHTFPPAIGALIVPAASVIWLAVAVDLRLSIVVAISAILIVLVIPILTRNLVWRAARETARMHGELVAELSDDLHGAREVLTFGADERRLASADARSESLRDARGRASIAQAIRSGVVIAIQLGTLIALVGVGVAVHASTTSLLVALAVSVMLWVPMRGVDGFLTTLDASFAAAARVYEVSEARPHIEDDPRMSQADAAAVDAYTVESDAVEFDGVSFTYPSRGHIERRPALRHATLRIGAGTWSYIVGVSGSGKSTIGALLVRGWDVDEGEIRLGGMPIRSLALEDLRSRVALVPQSPVLIRDTLRENLRLANPHAADDLLYDALAAVELSGWATSLDHKLDTQLSAGATDVSGGQLQRIALARALVSGAEILVLDEALSQLDAATAASVRANLREWPPQHISDASLASASLTIVEITHRTDLIDDDSSVTVLDNGEIVESGTAHSLRKSAGAFTRLEARFAP